MDTGRGGGLAGTYLNPGMPGSRKTQKIDCEIKLTANCSLGWRVFARVLSYYDQIQIYWTDELKTFITSVGYTTDLMKRT